MFYKSMITKINVVELYYDSYDFVTLYDGETILDDQLDRLTGSSLPNPFQIMSRSNKILVNFQTDDSETRPGFRIQYEESKSIFEQLLN